MARKISFKKAFAIVTGGFVALILLAVLAYVVLMPGVDSSSFWTTRAIEESYFYDNPQVRATLLADVANAQLALGRHEKALKTVQSMRKVQFSFITKAKRKAQELLAKVGIGKGPQQIAKTFAFNMMPNYEAKAYAAIAASQANAGFFAEAIETAKKIQSMNTACFKAYADIAEAQARAGDFAGASATLKAMPISEETRSFMGMVKAEALKTIAAEHARRGNLPAAVNVLESFDNEIPFYGRMLQPAGYAAVTKALADTGRFELAAEYIGKIQQSDAKAEAQAALAQALARERQFNEALDVAAETGQRKARLQVLGQLAEIMVEKGEKDKALALAESHDESYVQSFLFSRISRTLAEQGHPREAENLAKQVEDAVYKKECLMAAANAYLAAAELHPAEAIAQQLEGSDRIAALLAVAELLADTDKARENSNTNDQKMRAYFAEAEIVAKQRADNELWLQIALAYAYVGDLEAMRAIFEQTFKKDAPEPGEVADDTDPEYSVFPAALPKSIDYNRLEHLQAIAREFAIGGNNMHRLDDFWHGLKTPAERLHCAIGAAQGLVEKENNRR